MILTNIKIGQIIGNSSFLLSLGLFYNSQNNELEHPYKKVMGIIIIISVLKDSLTFCNFGHLGISIQLILGMIVHYYYILIFKREKSYLSILEIKSLFKILIPAIVCFLFFGFFILRNVPQDLYVQSMAYILLIMPFIILSLFRPYQGLKHSLVSLGAIFKMLAVFLFSIYYLVNKNLILILLYIVLYSISQYLMINGLLICHNKGYETNILRPSISLDE